MNPYIMEVLLRERKGELLREAKRCRLIAEYKTANPSGMARLLATLGDLLIRLGEKLKKRYGMPAPSLVLQHPCKEC
ncbi:MAG: hypothetical protein V2I36_07070 [Desulfopila sp.]|jgi:hypothetical protein|nr:hypothetical protein [Desulfopila sp.]